MKSFLSLRSMRFLPLLFFLSAFSPPLEGEQILKILVRKGDTVSYLSFKIYGMYDLQVAEILKKENPQIKDLNWIYAGQHIHFPSPEALRRKLGGKSLAPAQPEQKQESQESRPPEPSLVRTHVRANKAVITFLEGTVQIRKPPESHWSPAQPNTILGERDQVKVLGRSRAELILDNQSVMRLSENSVLTIQQLEEEATSQKETARMDLSLGRLWVRVAKLFNRASRYDVKTPTVIAGVQGTTYQILVNEDRSTTIQVFQGAVNVYNPFPPRESTVPEKPIPLEKPQEVAGPREVPGPAAVSREEWTQIVLHPFQQITVKGRQIPQLISFDAQKERQEEWTRWNEERDADFHPPARSR